MTLPAELASGVRARSRCGSSTATGGCCARCARTTRRGRATVPLAEVSDDLVHAVLAAEDRRFYDHPGVDSVAVVRAAWSDAAHARVVSGASTLTMQLARLVRPHRRERCPARSTRRRSRCASRRRSRSTTILERVPEPRALRRGRARRRRGEPLLVRQAAGGALARRGGDARGHPARAGGLRARPAPGARRAAARPDPRPDGGGRLDDARARRSARSASRSWRAAGRRGASARRTSCRRWRRGRRRSGRRSSGDAPRGARAERVETTIDGDLQREVRARRAPADGGARRSGTSAPPPSSSSTTPRATSSRTSARRTSTTRAAGRTTACARAGSPGRRSSRSSTGSRWSGSAGRRRRCCPTCRCAWPRRTACTRR